MPLTQRGERGTAIQDACGKGVPILAARARSGLISDDQDEHWGRTMVKWVWSMLAAKEALRECLDAGMAWTVMCSVEAAVGMLGLMGSPCAQTRPALWVWGVAHMMALPAHTGAQLPQMTRFFDEITFQMVFTLEGAPRAAAALRACVPYVYTPDGRRSDECQGSLDLEEIIDAVDRTRPGFSMMTSPTRQGSAFTAHMRRWVQPDVP